MIDLLVGVGVEDDFIASVEAPVDGADSTRYPGLKIWSMRLSSRSALKGWWLPIRPSPGSPLGVLTERYGREG